MENRSSEKAVLKSMKYWLMLGKLAYLGSFREAYPTLCQGYSVDELNKLFIQAQKEVYNK